MKLYLLALRRDIDSLRRRCPLLQFMLCLIGLHLWERQHQLDWCNCCQTPR